MKTKIAVTVAVVVVAAGALLLTRGGPEPANIDPPKKYWAGDHCPITGKKYDAADPNDAMAGNLPLEFEHDGVKYEVNVWSESALDEFNQNRDKYLEKIIAHSE